MDTAESPAKVLQSICEKLQFPPDIAAGVNAGNYRTKMSTLMEKKSLTDEDVDALARVRRLLCIPKSEVDACTVDICGAVYASSVRYALGVGVEAFVPELRDRCKRAKDAVRLTDDMALTILSAEVKKAFMIYIKDARVKPDKRDQSKELRKMVYFNTAVVTPMVRDVTRAAAEDAAKELAELMKEAQAAAKKEEEEEAAAAAVAAAAAAAEAAAAKAAEAGAAGEGEAALAEKPEGEAAAAATASEKTEGDVDVVVGEVVGEKTAEEEAEEEEKPKEPEVVVEETPKYQKEINVSADLEVDQRTGMYQDYLMFCIQGDTITGPMGIEMEAERDQSEFVRLTQLGDILGLTPMEVGMVHKGLADKAYRAQAEQILGDGRGLTKERAEKLREVQASLSLPEADAQRIIKGITSQKTAKDMQAQVAMGTLTIADVRRMKEEGVEIEIVLSPDKRMALFRKNAESRLTDGSGSSDLSALSETLVSDLGLDPVKAKSELLKIANDKKRSTMVMAVSELRQKQVSAIVRSCKNLVACHGVAPESKLAWGVQEELGDIYSVFAMEGATDEEKAKLQEALGLDDATTAGLREIVGAGKFQLKQDVADEAIF